MGEKGSVRGVGGRGGGARGSDEREGARILLNQKNQC